MVTDSTPYLSPALIDRWGIHPVSLYVGWDGDLRPEDQYDDLDAFYERLRESPTLPSTSQPSMGISLPATSRWSLGARCRLRPHRKWLSGTCESGERGSADQPESGHPGRVEVVDGQTGAGGLGCLVIAAAREAEQGSALDRVVDAVREAREGLEIWFCLDTLEYLRRGGRIGAAQAMLGTALRVKPILTFGTEIAPVGRVRTRRRALERMDAYLEQLHERGATDWVVQHAQSPEDAKHLAREGHGDLRRLIRSSALKVGPVLGAHLGSGMLVGGIVRARSRPQARTARQSLVDQPHRHRSFAVSCSGG